MYYSFVGCRCSIRMRVLMSGGIKINLSVGCIGVISVPLHRFAKNNNECRGGVRKIIPLAVRPVIPSPSIARVSEKVDKAAGNWITKARPAIILTANDDPCTAWSTGKIVRGN